MSLASQYNCHVLCHVALCGPPQLTTYVTHPNSGVVYYQTITRLSQDGCGLGQAGAGGDSYWKVLKLPEEAEGRETTGEHSLL